MLWPEDGRLMKVCYVTPPLLSGYPSLFALRLILILKQEDIRGIFDGSIFYTIAARRENKKKQ
jgi:hypothetical protein